MTLAVTIILCLYDIDYSSKYLIYGEPYNICLFVPHFILLSTMSSRFIHVVAYYSISFIVKALHPSMDTWVSYIHVLAVVNDAVINTGLQISQDLAFSSFGCVPQCGIAELYGNSLIF